MKKKKEKKKNEKKTLNLRNRVVFLNEFINEISLTYTFQAIKISHQTR